MTSPDASVVVSPAGDLAAVVHGDSLQILGLPDLAQVGEVGLDAEAIATDVALVGNPARLVVLAHHPDRTRIHVIDPRGPSPIADVSLHAQMRLLAASGDHILLGSGSSTA